jgi:lipopolysaccharide export system permease protein
VFTLTDRYIAKSFLTYFILGLTVFLTLFFVIDFMTQMMRFDVSLQTLGRYYGVYLFEILYQFMPVAALVGVVFTLSSLNRSRELTALFSVGMSLPRILLPMFFWIVIIVGASFYIGDQVLPVTKQKRDYIYYVEMKKQPGLFSTVRTDKIWYRSDNIIFNIQLLNPEKALAHGLTFYYFSPDWKLQQMITSKKASITPGLWKLSDGTITLFVDDLTRPLMKKFEKKNVAMTEELSDIQTTSSASDFLSFRELRRYIKKNRDAGLNMTSFEVDYHNKLSFPFTIFVMALVGVPFVITHQRSGGMAKNIGLVLLMTFGFWVLYSSSMTFGRHGQVPPFIAAWGPNMLMLLITYGSYRWKRS